MLTLAQITAIISLLIAFGVPQNKTEEVQGILMHSAQVSTPVSIGAPSVIVSNMKPAYTESELLHLFNSMEKNKGFDESIYKPVAVTNVSSTTAGISLAGGGHAFLKGEVWFNGSKLNLTNPTYATELTGLTPNTTYTYQFKWIEEGRENTVIEGSFKTQI